MVLLDSILHVYLVIRWRGWFYFSLSIYRRRQQKRDSQIILIKIHSLVVCSALESRFCMTSDDAPASERIDSGIIYLIGSDLSTLNRPAHTTNQHE